MPMEAELIQAFAADVLRALGAPAESAAGVVQRLASLGGADGPDDRRRAPGTAQVPDGDEAQSGGESACGSGLGLACAEGADGAWDAGG